MTQTTKDCEHNYIPNMRFLFLGACILNYKCTKCGKVCDAPTVRI